MAWLMAYTRKSDAIYYPDGLARSMHLAYSLDGRQYHFLHDNYGLLFAEGKIDSENVILPRGLKSPRLFAEKDGRFAVVAELVRENGKSVPENEGSLFLWYTEDFLYYSEPVRITEEQLTERWTCMPEIIKGCGQTAYPEGMDEAGILEIEDSVCEKMIHKLRGSAANMNLKRDELGYEYPFPLAKGYADPVIFHWEGKYYFISTNDNTDDVGIYVREADHIPALFDSQIQQHLILPYDEKRGLMQTFWAPEFHVIGGRLFILFAVSGEKWEPQCHMMRLKEGGHITDSKSWEDPVRVRRSNGEVLSDTGITLDMTYLHTQSGGWLVWSYREHIGQVNDSGSMLYIARADETNPWMLAGEPVLLSRPLLGWENVAGTINNEGPHAFIRNGKIYLTYSGGSANAYTYAIGLLTARDDADLTDLRVWKKRNSPVLSFASVPGLYGPGHNSFFTDEEGHLMIACHGVTGYAEHERCSEIHRICFDEDNEPIFEGYKGEIENEKAGI